MANRNDTRSATFPQDFSGVSQLNRLVELISTGIRIAGSGDAIIGLSKSLAPFGGSEKQAVQLVAKNGTMVCVANGAGNIGDYAILATNGEVSLQSAVPAMTDALIGVAKDAATADGDEIEVVPCIVGRASTAVATSKKQKQKQDKEQD